MTTALQLSKKWEELADIKDELAWRDWFPGTSGNLSIKVADDPLAFLVTASGKDKRKRTSEDFLLVGPDSQPLEPTALKPSAETVLHQRIYEKTDAGCSLHVHTVDNNVISELYADRGEIVFSKQELIKAFNIWEENGTLTVPIVENYADLNKLADAVAERIQPDIHGVLIRNHGITAWGHDGFDAKKKLEAFEFLFSYQVKKELLLR